MSIFPGKLYNKPKAYSLFLHCIKPDTQISFSLFIGYMLSTIIIITYVNYFPHDLKCVLQISWVASDPPFTIFSYRL